MFNLTAFLSYAFAVTFSPGPNNILSMSNAGQNGYKNTLPFILGITSGFVVIMIVTSYFNLVMFNIMPQVEKYMKYIGACYMLYLTLKVLGVKFSKKKNTPSSINNYRTGLLMQFLNPKVILYGITITSGFIIPHFQGTVLIAFSLLLTFFAFVSTSCWALFGSVFKKLLATYSRQFNIMMAGLLVYSAIKILDIL